MNTLEKIKKRLVCHEPEVLDIRQDTRQAAVAMVVRQRIDHCDILFIKRAATSSDPWSGQMAFPGGHKDSSDSTLQSAAMREAHEETGLDLRPAEYLGALSHQRAVPRGRVINMLVAPFVFGIHHDPDFKPNHEVDDIVWGSLPEMFNGCNHGTENFMIGNTTTKFNGYLVKPDRFVWGLTYRMLQTFFKVLDVNYVEPLNPA